MRVLIVDDDEAYLQLLRMILERKGHEIVEAVSGKEAWELLQKDHINFVVTDWMLPEMDGVDLIRSIRSANFEAYTYIILLTAKKSKDDVVDGLESGADDYLTKPFDLSELRARVGIGERILELETKLRDSMIKLNEQATRDSLTGLLIRRALYESAERELARTSREGTSLSVVMFDLDHFKAINDQHGHLVGDDALRMVANKITENKRSYDYAGRWGGEEFLLILPETDLESATLVAERLRSAISGSPLLLESGTYVSVGASFGVASTGTRTDVTLDQIIGWADEALYNAKQAGRNQVKVYAQTVP